MMSDRDRDDTPPTQAVARATPYELAFADAGFEERVFPRMQEEARSHGVDPALPERFVFLTAGAEAVRETIPPDAPPEALEQHRLLLYHAYNFWRCGRRLYVLDTALTRYLVEGAPGLEGWDLTLPHDSLYLQLPPNLFWASLVPDATPEPVDGFFVTGAREGAAGGYRRLHALMVTGLRPDRAGFGVVPFDSTVVPGVAAVWAQAEARSRGRDFETILPGGDLAGFYSILTTPEALKLVARALWYLDTRPGDVFSHPAAERRTEERPGSLPRTRLPYHYAAFSPEETG